MHVDFIPVHKPQHEVMDLLGCSIFGLVRKSYSNDGPQDWLYVFIVPINVNDRSLVSLQITATTAWVDSNLLVYCVGCAELLSFTLAHLNKLRLSRSVISMQLFIYIIEFHVVEKQVIKTSVTHATAQLLAALLPCSSYSLHFLRGIACVSPRDPESACHFRSFFITFWLL